MYAGKILRKLRSDLKISQVDMCNKLNIAQSYYSTFETNKREMPNDLIEKIKDIFNIKEDLFSDIQLDINSDKDKYGYRYNSKDNVIKSKNKKDMETLIPKNTEQTQKNNQTYKQSEANIYSNSEIRLYMRHSGNMYRINEEIRKENTELFNLNQDILVIEMFNDLIINLFPLLLKPLYDNREKEIKLMPILLQDVLKEYKLDKIKALDDLVYLKPYIEKLANAMRLFIEEIETNTENEKLKEIFETYKYI